MSKKITNKQRQKQLKQKQIQQHKKKQKQIQQHKKKQKQIQQKRIQEYKKRQKRLQKQRKIYQQKRQKKIKQLRQYQKKQRELRLNRGCRSECQCNFHREDDYEYYGNCNYNNCNHHNNHHNHHHNHHNNNNQCSCSHCGVNLPPNDVCVPSRNYQFFQLPNAPIYDIPGGGYGGGFGSGLGHDMRMPYISPHAGMDMFTGSLDAPSAPNPMYLSYPLF